MAYALISIILHNPETEKLWAEQYSNYLAWLFFAKFLIKDVKYNWGAGNQRNKKIIFSYQDTCRF